MPPDDSGSGYTIWGADHRPYGPVELPELVSWIKDERVTADTWVYLERSDCWEKASHLPELQMFFHGRHAASTNQSTENEQPGLLNASAFRHIRLLAGLNDEQLDRFLHTMEVVTVPAGTPIVRQNEPSNAMHLLLEGELRARANLEGRDTSLGTLNAGEFFGEISLFDHGPRTAEITASQESIVMRIPAADFEKLMHEKPELAAPFLFALTKALAARIRADHKRYRDSVSFIHPPGR